MRARSIRIFLNKLVRDLRNAESRELAEAGYSWTGWWHHWLPRPWHSGGQVHILLKDLSGSSTWSFDSRLVYCSIRAQTLWYVSGPQLVERMIPKITIENGFPALDIRANCIGLPRPWHSQLTSAAAGQLVEPLKRRKKYFNFGPKTNLFQCVCILSQKIGIFNLTKHIKPDLYVFISTVPTFTCINENQSDP